MPATAAKFAPFVPFLLSDDGTDLQSITWSERDRGESAEYPFLSPYEWASTSKTLETVCVESENWGNQCVK
ncbi:hypothetical protein RCH07_003713 [Arthrobacter sp. CG_A4]|nr:hypothetical protein [Arthrobacter sp. CG_A4]